MALTSVNMAYAASDTAETTEAAAEDESADSTDTTTDEAEATEVYGEVTEVGEDSITINVGTPKEGQQPDGQDPKLYSASNAFILSATSSGKAVSMPPISFGSLL